MKRGGFSVALRIPDTTNVRASLPTYDPKTEDIRSILSDLCRTVAKEAEFLVRGFGQKRWPVDVATDLTVFLEQLPAVLRAVKMGVPAEVDFYEQGIERRIELAPEGDSYSATCTSQTEWQPNPSVEKVDRADLEAMLVDVQEKVVKLIADIAPHLSEHHWVRSWLDGETEI